MAVKVFQPAEDREACKDALRQGATIEECLQRFSISKATAWRYLHQVQKEQETGTKGAQVEDSNNGDDGEAKKAKSIVNAPVAVGVGDKSFVPSGQRSSAPSGEPAPEWLTVGTFRMPLLDWGYSSSKNLFIVADTYDIAKKQYNFPKEMKVGDFLAELCQMLRMMCGWDNIGSGVYEVNIEQEGNNGNRE